MRRALHLAASDFHACPVRRPQLGLPTPQVELRDGAVRVTGANSAGASAAKYALRRRAIPDDGGGPEWQLRWHF